MFHGRVKFKPDLTANTIAGERMSQLSFFTGKKIFIARMRDPMGSFFLLFVTEFQSTTENFSPSLIWVGILSLTTVRPRTKKVGSVQLKSFQLNSNTNTTISLLGVFDSVVDGLVRYTKQYLKGVAYQVSARFMIGNSMIDRFGSSVQ
jgi:hypothetical protein